MKKILSMLVVLALVVGATCGLADGYTINNDSLYPVLNEPGAVNLDIAIMTGANDGDLDEMWFYKWWQNKTNVSMALENISSEAWGTRKSLIMASGDLADVYYGFSWTANDIMQYGQSDGYFLALNDYIEAYGDQILTIDEYIGHSSFLGAATTPDGNIYSLPRMTEAGIPMLNRTTYGMSVNNTILADLNLEKPETIDEFLDVLSAYQASDYNGNGEADELAFSAQYSSEWRSLMLAIWGFVTDGNVANNIALKSDGADGFSAVYIPYDADYKEYLAYMNKLYAGGLMDAAFFTQDATTRAAKNMENPPLTVQSSLDSSVGNSPEIFENYETFLLTAKEGQTPITYNVRMCSIGAVVVTEACEYPDVAVALFDTLYDARTAAYYWNGPNITEDLENYDDYAKEIGAGHTIKYDENGRYLTYEYPNYDSKLYSSVGSFLGAKIRASTGMLVTGIYARVLTYNADPKTVDTSTGMGWFRASQQQNTLPYIAFGYPEVYLSGDETEVVQSLQTQIEDYVYSMEAQFISGAISIEEQYDAFLAELERLGVKDYLAIYQNAYQTYLDNL